MQPYTELIHASRGYARWRREHEDNTKLCSLFAYDRAHDVRCSLCVTSVGVRCKASNRDRVASNDAQLSLLPVLMVEQTYGPL